jgi:predicted nucleotidyltransferase
MELRRFLRNAAPVFCVDWAIQRFSKQTTKQVDDMLKKLRAEGFIEPSETAVGNYEITEKGRSFARSTAAKAIARATAEKALQKFLLRVEEVNRSARFIRSVKAVVVFGSYLTDKEKLNDVDVAVKLICRWPESMSAIERHQRDLDHTTRSGRRFSNIVECLAWPEREVELYVRNRARCLSLQDWHSFVMIAHKGRADFACRILLGDEEEIKKEITNLKG